MGSNPELTDRPLEQVKPIKPAECLKWTSSQIATGQPAMGDTLSLEGKLDLAVVSQLHDDLMARAGQDVIVSLGNVTQMGALCVQTLIAAANSARASDNNFRLTNTSDRVLSQLAAMGMTPETIMEGSN